MTTPVLHDATFLVHRLVDEIESKVLLRCVDCGTAVEAGYELDASARCIECQP